MLKSKAMFRSQKCFWFLTGMGCDKNITKNIVKKNISDNVKYNITIYNNIIHYNQILFG